MATLKEIAYKIWRRLEGGNIPDDSKWTYREMLSYARGGVASALKQSYYEQRNLEDFKYGDDAIAATYTASVLFDEVKSLNYVVLVNDTISIAGNRFIDVNPANMVSRWGTIFIPIRREEVFVGKLQADVPMVTQYYRDNDRLYFYGSEVKDTKVSITEKYNIPASDTEKLSMPTEFENQIVEQAYKSIVAPQVQADKQNDGTASN